VNGCHYSLKDAEGKGETELEYNRNHGYLPSRTASTTLGQYQIMLLGGYSAATRTASRRWLRSPTVEHRSLAGVLSLSCARLVADG